MKKSKRLLAMTKASRGRAGMSQRKWIIVTLSSLHPVDLIQIGGFVMAVDSDNQGQSNCRFCGGDGNREDDKHQAGVMVLGMVAIAPKSNKIQVGRIEH